MNFQRVTPESVGIPSGAILDMLDQLYREGIEMHAFKLLRHGKVCAEGSWAPYAPETQHILFSFSKSFTSTAIGFAVQEGIISLDERLIDIFPDKCPEEPSENLKKCQVRHLLMMGCGHETEISWADGGSDDWVAEFMHHPFVYEPGTHFLYNTAGTNMLCAILKRKTGLDMTEFLRPRLFEPLGMGEIHCVKLPGDIEMGGAGMSVTIEEMARFVQFVANKGSWEGRQLLNPEWFDMATSKQIDNAGAGWGGDPDWQAGYCFQFWRCAPEGVFRGDGAYGQYGIVMTKQDAVLVIHSASMKLQAVLTAVWDNLLPAMAEEPLPEDPRAHHMLAKRLERLELNPMLGVRNPGAEASLNGAVYLPVGPAPCLRDIVGGPGCFGPEGGRLESVTFRFEGTKAWLVCKEDRGEYTLDLGLEGHFATSLVHGVPFGANSSWRAHDTLEVHLVNTRMVRGKRLLFRFSGTVLQLTGTPTLPEAMSLGDVGVSGLSFELADGEVNTKTRMYWEVNG